MRNAFNQNRRDGGTRLVEALEGRQFFSAAVLGSEGVLTVSGAGGQPNRIVVTESADGKKINVAVAAALNNPAVTRTFDAAKVKKIFVNGGNKADVIAVGQTGGAITVPTRVSAKEGADSIKTGGGNDSIYGGKGNDTIYAGTGNDVLYGEDGDDLLFGGEGKDTLWGSYGKDRLYGEAGDDFLGGYWGVNVGYGGTGKDTFLVAKTLAGSFSTSDFVTGEDILKIGTEPA